jgi:hypothetical protein
MSRKYQIDVAFDLSKPIYALVTNFNFSDLSRWLDKNSRNLKDRLEEPRILHITSVLLSPDYAVDTLSPHKPEAERNNQSALDAHKNSLSTLERNLETWCRSFTACDQYARDVFRFATVGLGSQCINPKVGSFERLLVADRSGTPYAVAWKIRTIHRQHRISGPDPTSREITGMCYRRDFCHHLLLRNISEIKRRVAGNEVVLRFVIWLEDDMLLYHNKSAHAHNGSFLQMMAYKKKRTNHIFQTWLYGLSPARGEQEMVAFYQRLDRLNISRGPFERELEQRRDYPEQLTEFGKGLKRAFAKFMEDGRPMDGAARQNGRGQVIRCVSRRKPWIVLDPCRRDEKEQLRIPTPWVGVSTRVFTGDLYRDGVVALTGGLDPQDTEGATHEANMALVTRMMELLGLDD